MIAADCRLGRGITRHGHPRGAPCSLYTPRAPASVQITFPIGHLAGRATPSGPVRKAFLQEPRSTWGPRARLPRWRSGATMHEPGFIKLPHRAGDRA